MVSLSVSVSSEGGENDTLAKSQWNQVLCVNEEHLLNAGELSVLLCTETENKGSMACSGYQWKLLRDL